MRDDILSIIRDVIVAHDEKISLLKELLAEEHHLNSVLMIEFDNEPLIVMDSQNNLINSINLQDFRIAELEEKFHKKTGIQLTSSADGLCSEDYDRIREVDKRRKQEKKILTDIMNLRNKNVLIMEKIKSATLKDADELKKIMELDPDYSDDAE